MRKNTWQILHGSVDCPNYIKDVTLSATALKGYRWSCRRCLHNWTKGWPSKNSHPPAHLWPLQPPPQLSAPPVPPLHPELRASSGWRNCWLLWDIIDRCPLPIKESEVPRDSVCDLHFHEEESEPAPDRRDEFSGSQKYPQHLGEPLRPGEEHDLQPEGQESSHRRPVQ